MCSFLLLPHSVTPTMSFKHFIWKACNFLGLAEWLPMHALFYRKAQTSPSFDTNA
jgi:hypothetical protein